MVSLQAPCTGPVVQGKGAGEKGRRGGGEWGEGEGEGGEWGEGEEGLGFRMSGHRTPGAGRVLEVLLSFAVPSRNVLHNVVPVIFHSSLPAEVLTLSISAGALP